MTDREVIPCALQHYVPEVKRGPYFSAALAKDGEFDYLKKEGVKVYVQLGTAEVLRDEVRSFVKGLQRDGVDVKLTEVGILTGLLYLFRLVTHGIHID